MGSFVAPPQLELSDITIVAGINVGDVPVAVEI
jgi:hypothetical protein